MVFRKRSSRDFDEWSDAVVASIANARHSCSLDVADEGGHTLAEVAAFIGVTRERIRQLEVSALRKLKEHAAAELWDALQGLSSVEGELS